MPGYYFPKTEVQDFINALSYGFYLETSEDGKVAVLVKVEPAIMNSIISGCPIKLIIRNPNLFERSCTLYLYDLPNDPFHITWHQFSEEDDFLKGFDKVAIDIALRSKEIILVLYNDLNHVVFKTELKISCDRIAFDKWVYKTYNSAEYRDLSTPKVDGNYYPEDEKKGFAVLIHNIDNSKTEKIKILSPEYADLWRQNPMSDGELFDHSAYNGNGKHGALQELGISSKLEAFFTPEKDFFVSPKDAKGLEFTDFILFDNNAVLIIESKYIISTKSTKRHANITKAIRQLERAETAIVTGKAKMANLDLQEKLNNTEIVIKVCLYNDRVHFDDKYRKSLASQFSKFQLPIFISVTVFSVYLTSLRLKNPDAFSYNMMANLIAFYDNFLDGNSEIPLLVDFRINGMSAAELNALGKNIL